MNREINEKKKRELSKVLMNDLLKEATDTVIERNKKYGRPYENHQRIADLWDAYFTGTQKPVRPHDVVVAMILAKIARLEETPDHHDSWLDIAGYAAVGRSIIGEEELLND